MNPTVRRFVFWLGVALAGFLAALAFDGHPLTWGDVAFTVLAAISLVSLLILPYSARR